MSTIFPAMRFHGCINDCLFVTNVPHGEIEYALEHDCKPDEAVPAKKAYYLFWPDGSARFKVKELTAVAPKLEWSHRYNRPRPSAWRARNTEPLNAIDDDIAFGYWSTNAPFKNEAEWRLMDEPEEVGRGPSDTFQNEVADAIVKNRGGYVDGRGGTGKSWLIKMLVEKFETEGFFDMVSNKKGEVFKKTRVHCVAFTHVASQNIEGQTLLHELHRHARSKRLVVIVDEAGLVPLSMWSLLLNLKFTGNIVVALGDFGGQMLAIQDQSLGEKLRDFPISGFMYDLCNGLFVQLQRYRRGDDFEHFRFVGSIYPKHGVELDDALEMARERYPARGAIFFGTTLCLTHRCRVVVNAAVNKALARSNAVLVSATSDNSLPNQPQDMFVWPGIVLMAIVPQSTALVKNGVRYEVLNMEGDHHFELVAINDDGARTATSFIVDKKELGSNFRLTHALTYFSAQARTIHGGIRLAQTSHKNFTLRHLVLGLGRAPRGCDVQVEG